jgi:hypothetical protein
MSDYTPIILGMVALAAAGTVAVVYLLAQPSDLPSVNKKD